MAKRKRNPIPKSLRSVLAKSPREKRLTYKFCVNDVAYAIRTSVSNSYGRISVPASRRLAVKACKRLK